MSKTIEELQMEIDAAKGRERDAREDYASIEASAAAIVKTFQSLFRQDLEFMDPHLRQAIEELRDGGRDNWWETGKWSPAKVKNIVHLGRVCADTPTHCGSVNGMVNYVSVDEVTCPDCLKKLFHITKTRLREVESKLKEKSDDR